jgi:hypothetical protein
VDQISNLVDSYVACWTPHRPNYSGIYEDNDFGCEHFQIFRNGFSIETFTHEEISLVVPLLTRELRGQINTDHKTLWAWSAQLPMWHTGIELFRDHDWVSAFQSLVHLSLASQRRVPAGPSYLAFQQAASGYVNSHLMTVAMEKHLVGGPLSLSVLEGLLRRKNRSYVDTSGLIIRQFAITDSGNQSQTYGPPTTRKRLNRIDDSFRLFEQLTTADRSRACIGLAQMKQEILRLYNAADVYDLVDSWRNELIHGNQYWMDRLPIVLNLACLLVIDEIIPSDYDQKLPEIQRRLEWSNQIDTHSSIRPGWEIYPPDIG